MGFAGNCINLGQAGNRGKFDEAIDMLSQFLDANNTIPKLDNLRGIAYAKKGDWDHAQEDFAQVVCALPRSSPGPSRTLNMVHEKLASPPK